jgi:transcriptional regulator with XRE-family HTH domain
MYLSKNIRFLRESTGKTQKDISDLIGMKSHQIIGKYETDRADPPIEVIQKLAECFGVSMEELMFKDIAREPRQAPVAENTPRMIRLMEKELDRLEQLEQQIKGNPKIMDQIKKIDPGLYESLDNQ